MLLLLLRQFPVALTTNIPAIMTTRTVYTTILPATKTISLSIIIAVSVSCRSIRIRNALCVQVSLVSQLTIKSPLLEGLLLQLHDLSQRLLIILQPRCNLFFQIQCSVLQRLHLLMQYLVLLYSHCVLLSGS